MLNFSRVALLIFNATVKEYTRVEFMNLICDRAYRECGGGSVPDEGNFGKWMNGKSQREGFKIVNEYYCDPRSVDGLAEDIESLLIDSIVDLPGLMESLELVMEEDVEQGYLSIRRKEQLLSGTEAQQLAKILQYVITKRKNHAPIESSNFSKMFIGADLPHSSCPFVCREMELERIKKRLIRSAVLFLTGIHGAGKTALAVKYAKRNREKYKNCVFIRYRRSFRETIMSLEVSEEWEGSLMERSYQHRLERFKKLKSDSLLILDGMEVLPEDDNSFDDLLGLNCHVLVTTILQVEENSLYVGMLRDRKELLELFRAYCPCIASKEDEIEAQELIDLVHWHTYAVIMMALTVKSGCVTAAELRDYIIENGLSFPNEIKIRTVKDGKRLRKPFFELLKGLYALQDLTQEQQNTLMNLACIPPFGMQKREFLAWSRTSIDAMCDLICLGWIQEEEDNRIVIQGLVREMVIEMLHPTVASCRSMIRTILDQCSCYYQMEQVAYKEHDRMSFICECMHQILSAVMEDTEECVLIHTQLSVYTFALALMDRSSLYQEYGARMKKLDKLIITMNIGKIMSEGYQKTAEYMAILKYRLKEGNCQSRLVCSALYEETKELLQSELKWYEEIFSKEPLINSDF